MTKKDAEKVSKLMKNLNLTEEEAIQVLNDDKEIDKGKDLFPLTPEQKKAEKAARITTAKATKNNQTRERKQDNDKRYLINIIAEGLRQMDIDPSITNDEREMIFSYNGKKYKLVLSAPRK